jgi:hypothetical protein
MRAGSTAGVCTATRQFVATDWSTMERRSVRPDESSPHQRHTPARKCQRAVKSSG